MSAVTAMGETPPLGDLAFLAGEPEVARTFGFGRLGRQLGPQDGPQDGGR